MSDEATVAPTARIEVLGGGAVPPELLAATVVALAPRGGSAPPPAPRTPAWARAALLEGVGGRRPTRPSDLERTAALG